MKRLTLFIISALLFSGMIAAGEQNRNREGRKQWLKEMRQLRTNYVVKNLELTPEQRDKFVPAYNAMQSDIEKAVHDCRETCREVEMKGDKATDADLEKAAACMYEQKSKEGAIEMRYFTRFKQLLTPAQLFKLKNVEHKFNRELLKQKREHKNKHKNK